MIILIKSWSGLRLGHVGLKTRSRGQIIENRVYTLEGTVLIQSSSNFVRMIIRLKSRSSLKLGHVASKIRSLVQIKERPCVYSRGHSYDPKFMEHCQNVNPYKIKVKIATETC